MGGIAFAAYTEGGIVTELPFYQGKIWRRAFAGGIGYWHQIKVIENGNRSSFTIHGFIPHFKRVGTRMI